ncbi:hypothetical protein RHO13_00125 [Orbus wheelerorum]|uniref:hypothetical protein n=1 Tax=Orbus wheelerorum TaxID=3074111 RepID=UPI00370DA13F
MIFILWFIFSIVLGMLAKANGRSFIIWFILGVLVDPILGFILYKIVAKNN